MKVYNLSCDQSHRFEGWFSSEEDFIAQSARSLIECPLCSNRNISKLPSAPHLNLGAAQAPAPPQPKQENDANRLHARWLEAARQVLANTDDVGENFAEEARRIHYNEAPERGIRGVATADERDALSDEGIEVVQFPIPAALKQPLQ
ncbi:MAG: DUF1178 family protein [Pseudomonadota bacterium]